MPSPALVKISSCAGLSGTKSADNNPTNTRKGMQMPFFVVRAWKELSMSTYTNVPKYKRILLKIGGEAFAGPGGMGIVPHLAEEVAAKVKAVRQLGVQVAIVLGAGN